MEVRPAEHGRDAAARAFWMQAEKSNAEKLREFHRSSWQEVTTDRKLEPFRMRNRVLVIAADELHQRGNLLHGTFFTEDRPVAADIGRDPGRWDPDEVENDLPGFVDNGTAGGFKVAVEELALQNGPHLELLRRKCKSEWCETIVHDVDYGTTRVTVGRGVEIPPARGRSRERRWSGPTSNCAASTTEESGEQKQNQKSISWLDAESLESSAPLPRLFPETDGQFLGVSELRTKYYRAEVEWEIPRGITFKSKAAFQNPRPGSLREWRDRDCVWNYPQEAESTEAVAGVVVFYEKLEELEWVIEEVRSGSGSGRADKDIKASGERSPDPIPKKETTSTSTDTDVTIGENKKERKSAGAASDQPELEAMETLMKQMKDAHMTAKDLPDEQRRERASKLAMKMMDLLDLSDAGDDDDDDDDE
eukprot:g4659.t1